MLNTDALFDYLFEQGLQPEMVEEDTQIAFSCPLCQDDRPRLYVGADNGAWLCFHCHEQGGLHRLIAVVCEEDPSEAFDLVRQFTVRDEEDGFDYFEAPKQVQPFKDVERRLSLPEQFRPLDQRTPQIFRSYLARRHVSPELAVARGVGYAVTGRYAYRVILPVASDGHLYTFIARTVLSACPNCAELLDDCTCRPYKFPKVLTPRSKDGAQPRLTLYNLDAVRQSTSPRVVVVEGVFDALRRPSEAVALMGSSASDTQVLLLTGLAHGREVVLALDGDEAGYKGAVRVAEALTGKAVAVRVAVLPEETDPGSLSAAALDKLISDAGRYVL